MAVTAGQFFSKVRILSSFSLKRVAIPGNLSLVILIPSVIQVSASASRPEAINSLTNRL
jgi:hypothetical protein